MGFLKYDVNLRYRQKMTIKPSGEVIIIREFTLIFFRSVELLNLSFIVLNIHVKNSKHLNKK